MKTVRFSLEDWNAALYKDGRSEVGKEIRGGPLLVLAMDTSPRRGKIFGEGKGKQRAAIHHRLPGRNESNAFPEKRRRQTNISRSENSRFEELVTKDSSEIFESTNDRNRFPTNYSPMKYLSIFDLQQSCLRAPLSPTLRASLPYSAEWKKEWGIS